MLERLKVRGEEDDRGWDCWMASPTQCTWIWVNSGSWWWTGRPGVLHSMRSQRVRHDWETELTPWLIHTHTHTHVLSCLLLFVTPWTVARKILWRREWLSTPIFLPGEFHGQKSLAGCSSWGHKELDTTERLTLSLFHLICYVQCYVLPRLFSHVNLPQTRLR